MESETRGRGSYLWRGGERVNLVKLPDRFTARLNRGVGPDTLESAYRVDHQRHLDRQDLEVFEAAAPELERRMGEIREGSDVQFASHVYALEDDPTSPIYLTDEITVQFKPEVPDDTIENVAAEFGLDLVKEVTGAPRTYVYRVTPQASENPIKIANRLQEMDDVLVSEPNIVVEQKPKYVPTDSLFVEQWHLHHTGGPFLADSSHIDAVRAWDVTRGDRSVVVAVADDSVDVHHDDFQGPGKIVAPRDFKGRDFAPVPEAADDNHGTACAGVAVAEENGRGVVGVAPGCALMPIRTTGYLDDNSIEDLFGWVVERGASVVSCSWGPAIHYFRLSLRQSLALRRAATLGRGGRGCVIVFAAGNSNRPIDGTVNERGWPNNERQGPTRWLDGYAIHPDVIAVAASTSEAKKSAYSNWGREISVCAPSNNARPDTYPLVTARLSGRGVVTTDRVGPSGYSVADYTRSFGGTSSACPTVAGVAALVLSANPELTAVDVREILQSTADKIVDHDRDPQLEQNLGSYDERGHSQWFGHGKVNARKAVTEAVRRRAGAGQQTFRSASAPVVAIPDANTTGVRDRITIADAATLSSIKVHVDITHTFIGDLRLTLTAPSGTVVVLHDRAGGGADDLRRTFDLTSTPGLSTLVGQSLQGEWMLHVQDLASIDVGRLNRWEIEAEGQVAAPVDVVVQLDESPGLTIPDNDANGVERALVAAATGRVKDVEVDIDITHTYIGDLIVTLVSPAGTPVHLHFRHGGSADNLITTYSAETTPDLQNLRGEAVAGTWQLRVTDREAVDVGKLNRWTVRIARAP